MASSRVKMSTGTGWVKRSGVGGQGRTEQSRERIRVGGATTSVTRNL